MANTAEKQIVKIPNFNLAIFRQLLKQNLMVNDQIMIEFNKDFVRSCAISPKKTLMKLWMLPTKLFIVDEEKKDENGVIQMDDTVNVDEIVNNIPKFNFYILRGDLFKNYLIVHNSGTVDLEFEVRNDTTGSYAETIKINGQTENGNNITTIFTLTSEELILNKIDDYNELIKRCTPDDTLCDIIIEKEQMEEIKRLLKNLNQSSIDNSNYLTFTVVETVLGDRIKVNDKVFSVEFPLKSSSPEKLKGQNLSFNMLKTDFIMTGDHNFNLYTKNDDEPRIVLYTKFGGAIIYGLATKITENNVLDNSASFDEVDLDRLDEMYNL